MKRIQNQQSTISTCTYSFEPTTVHPPHPAQAARGVARHERMRSKELPRIARRSWPVLWPWIMRNSPLLTINASSRNFSARATASSVVHPRHSNPQGGLTRLKGPRAPRPRRIDGGRLERAREFVESNSDRLPRTSISASRS